MAQNWGPHKTAFPILCTEEMIDLGLYQGNVNGATFEDFVDEKLSQLASILWNQPAISGHSGYKRTFHNIRILIEL